MEPKEIWLKVRDAEIYKVSASGNDFIVLINLDKKITFEEGQFLAQRLCRAKFSVSADGFILIEPPKDPLAQVSWNFFNSDGSPAEMCGNGARAVARLLYDLNLVPDKFYLETLAGLISAEIRGTRVRISLNRPKDLNLNFTIRTDYDWYLGHFVNTGVPHVVIFWENIEDVPIERIAPKIRYHEMFAPAGTNVNFIEVAEERGEKILKIRTYERGVEGETLACGTGACASAYIAYKLNLINLPVNVLTKGGEILTIDFDPQTETLYLEGETTLILRGKIFFDALR